MEADTHERLREMEKKARQSGEDRVCGAGARRNQGGRRSIAQGIRAQKHDDEDLLRKRGEGIKRTRTSCNTKTSSCLS